MKIMLTFHLIFLIVYIFMHLYFVSIKQTNYKNLWIRLKRQVHEIKNSLFGENF